MAQLISPPFGNGSDEALNISANTTDSPTDSACSGTATNTALTATNGSFSAGQLIMIHQTREGGTVGQWELNKISNYAPGTITTVLPLTYTYATKAQVLVMKEYNSININSGKTLTVKAWNGTVGGILAYLCSGTTLVTGNISADGGEGSGETRGTGGGFR